MKIMNIYDNLSLNLKIFKINTESGKYQKNKGISMLKSVLHTLKNHKY